mgnify:CR=1 FL=1
MVLRHWQKDREGQFNLPLYIISLVEHKTKVEYNVAMQTLRYMVYIREDYDREMTNMIKMQKKVFEEE